ncbi:SDR family NAD(P)-dependent oxidoreductase [Lentzea sp. NEAU-D7]|uniref:SDR family NAD(P)-dependent oxidoreductase n=1 Tax=Lentzea sp. NEAU-D7 TaxID=2994667 RepID=UPI00224B975A|nr:SDR family NAD(P)-dependent oxidoreductase [Lentzea sp. NEAU-D7]MCX2954372.1 SDR family NAD(P)-dependent oxidoreductase [Lentzea sp. NEAU-D7]
MSTLSGINASSILVLGATGKTGRRVTDLLGPAARPASRSASTRFDWAVPDTWEPAVAGTTAIYVVPPENPVLLADFVPVAVKAGVTRLVLLSMRGAPNDDPFESAIKESGAEWTILRPTWFMQNFDEDIFAPSVQQGALAVPAGQGVHPFIDVVDIAEVAVVALTRPGHHGQTYDLSGPEAVSFTEVLTRITAVTGSPVSYADIAPEEFAAAMRGLGYPDEIADLVTMLLVRIRTGEEAHLSDGVQRVLGREPRTFADYLGSSKFA